MEDLESYNLKRWPERVENTFLYCWQKNYKPAKKFSRQVFVLRKTANSELNEIESLNELFEGKRKW